MTDSQYSGFEPNVLCASYLVTLILWDHFHSPSEMSINFCKTDLDITYPKRNFLAVHTIRAAVCLNSTEKRGKCLIKALKVFLLCKYV